VPRGKRGLLRAADVFVLRLVLLFCFAVVGSTAANAGTGVTNREGPLPGVGIGGFPRTFAFGVGHGVTGAESSPDSAEIEPELTSEPEAPPPADDGGPSRAKTVLLSALVPGLGQLEAGEKTWGSVFLLGEVASWTSLIVFQTQGGNGRDDYIEFAERFAGVDDADGQSDSYYSALAQYDRSGEPGGPDSYNESEVRWEARQLYPNDPEAQAQYIAANEITGTLAWDWDTEDQRFDYADRRIASETAYHRVNYAIAGLVVGRVLSVLHAVWMTADDEELETEKEEDEAAEMSRFAPRDVAGSLAPLVESDVAHGRSRFGLRYRF
jgi:hypothetical protein